MSSDPALSNCYFLSYSRTDELFALRFATDLRNHGIAMWVDQLDIRPSEHWDRAIERAVHECRGLVVLLSPRSVESDNVADEISFAIDHRKSVLPVMIDRCRLPLRITRMQVIDAVGDYERALEQCIAVLSGEPVPSAQKPTLTPRADFDRETIAAAKSRLTPILGPIASILVDRNAGRASTVGELYELLGEHIESDKDRERFVAQSGEAVAAPSTSATRQPSAGKDLVAKAEVDRLATLLMTYLGPISAAVAKRESASAKSADDLRERLALLIPNERERADFVRKAQKP